MRLRNVTSFFLGCAKAQQAEQQNLDLERYLHLQAKSTHTDANACAIVSLGLPVLEGLQT